MNGRTTKLLRKLAVKTGTNYRMAKAAWNRMPQNERGYLRWNFEHTISDYVKELCQTHLKHQQLKPRNQPR